jgi:DNA-binding transcriptional MerR regulator
MLISELEKKTGLTRHTIRFYEKEGFLGEGYIRRGKNNYRSYSEDAVERLSNIKAGQAAGFTLAELKKLIDACDAGELTTRQKIDAIDRKRAELDRMQTYLITLLREKYLEEMVFAH